MPPSGYNTKQAQHVQHFLISCGESLISETLELGLNATQGLEREIANISILLSSSDFSSVERALFELNLQFYRKLLLSNPHTLDELQANCNKIAEEFRSEILSIDKRTKAVLFASQY
jgi:hypothetical protein